MKRRLVELLRCPGCGSTLRCHPFEERPDPSGLAAGGESYGQEIVEGILCCEGCTLAYPVHEEVPRVLRNALEEYPAWFATNRERIREATGRDDLASASVDATR